MSLYTKYRPDKLKDFYGNKEVVRALSSGIPQAILFSGPSGCGKTTLARIIANRLECEEYDIVELNTSNFRGIDAALSSN